MHAIVLALLLAGCGQAAETPKAAPAGYDFPALSGRVVDAAHLLPADNAQAEDAKLVDLERSTGHQLVVVTVPSLGGHTIEDYGRTLGNFWGIGRKDINDGVLLIVAPAERKVRIEVGRGLEKTLKDDEAMQIIQSDILPRFQRADFPGGIDAGVADIIREIGPEAQ